MNKSDIRKKIGQRIIELRLQKGWSQADLARACSKDRQAIERIENAKIAPSMYTLHEIANALEVATGKLISF